MTDIIKLGDIAAWLYDVEAEAAYDPRNRQWALDASHSVVEAGKLITTLTGHMLNAGICLNSGGTKAEALRILNAGIDISNEKREAGL